MAGPRCSPRQHEQVKTREVLDMVGSVAPVSTTPIEDRWFEDYVPGPVFWYGRLAVGEEEARQYDPQFFHADPEAAAAGPFQGLIAPADTV